MPAKWFLTGRCGTIRLSPNVTLGKKIAGNASLKVLQQFNPVFSVEKKKNSIMSVNGEHKS
jgi:hypothetical protein